MDTISQINNKDYIKANKEKIIELIQATETIKRENNHSIYLTTINRDFRQGVSFISQDMINDLKGASVWRSKFEEQADGEYGYTPIQPENYTISYYDHIERLVEVELINDVLLTLAKDETLFNLVTGAHVSHWDIIEWSFDECLKPFDFENFQDATYEEYKIRLNPTTGRVTQTKPRKHTRSVLVALNID